MVAGPQRGSIATEFSKIGCADVDVLVPVDIDVDGFLDQGEAALYMVYKSTTASAGNVGLRPQIAHS